MEIYINKWGVIIFRDLSNNLPPWEAKLLVSLVLLQTDVLSDVPRWHHPHHPWHCWSVWLRQPATRDSAQLIDCLRVQWRHRWFRAVCGSSAGGEGERNEAEGKNIKRKETSWANSEFLATEKDLAYFYSNHTFDNSSERYSTSGRASRRRCVRVHAALACLQCRSINMSI